MFLVQIIEGTYLEHCFTKNLQRQNIKEAIFQACRGISMILDSIRTSKCIFYSPKCQQIKLGMHINLSGTTKYKQMIGKMVVPKDELIKQWHKAREFCLEPAAVIEGSTFLNALALVVEQSKFDMVDLIMLQSDLVEMLKYNAAHKPLGLFLLCFFYLLCLCVMILLDTMNFVLHRIMNIKLCFHLSYSTPSMKNVVD